MKPFKCRASAIGKITTLPRSKKDQEAGILSQTAQTYVKDWLKGQPELYNRRKKFSSKYTYKGNAVEDNSIDFAAEILGYPLLFKNEESFENDYIKGTPDVIVSDCVLDLKNSWSQDTFPIFYTDIPSKDYWWQGQGYMWLTDRKHYKLVYTLTDTPPEQIASEARRYCYANYIDLDLYFDEVYEEFEQNMTYSDVDPELKIKVFEFDRDEYAIKLVQDRVLACRGYVEELLKILNHG
jgi:hypothetical protein